MSIADFTTLAAGILAAIGAGGVLVAAASDDTQRRWRLHRLGTCALNIGGLVLMIGSIAGWQGADAMFCGLLMVVFGTGTQAAPAATATPGTPPAPSR